MAQKHRFHQNKRQGLRAPLAPAARMTPPRAAPVERPAPIVYGEPFIVLEDEKKETFVYEGGSWVPYGASIAECRKTCQVRELPQRVNRKIRYEVRSPSDKTE